MTARAYTRFNVERLAVEIALTGENTVVTWPTPVVERQREEALGIEAPGTWLPLREDQARALYEALAEYFGHSGHDTRALRRDYDAERDRVDRLIAAVIDR